MPRTTAFSAVLPVLTLAFVASPASAADEDFQVWISESFSAPLSEDATGTLDLSQRIRDSGDQLLLRGTAEFRLSDIAVIGGGAAYVSTIDGADELRPHQQLTLTFGPLALRTRVEERFFQDADRMELRLRGKATVSLPLSHRLKAGLAGELFYTAQSQNSGEGARLEQWRANATLARHLADDLEVTLGYLAILAPRHGEPNRLSHVAQVSLTLKR